MCYVQEEYSRRIDLSIYRSIDLFELCSQSIDVSMGVKKGARSGMTGIRVVRVVSVPAVWGVYAVYTMEFAHRYFGTILYIYRSIYLSISQSIYLSLNLSLNLCLNLCLYVSIKRRV